MSHNPRIPPWSPELERQALGLLMLAYPFPDWLREKHFFAFEHKFLFRAARELRNVAQVAKRLRENYGAVQVHSYGLRATDLAEMCLEAEHAQRLGWPLPWDELRELSETRRLLVKLFKAEVMLRSGEWTAGEARASL